MCVFAKGCKEGQLLCLNSFDSPGDIPFIHLSCTTFLIRHLPLQTWLLVTRSCRACCCLRVSYLRCKILFAVTRCLQVLALGSSLTHDLAMREGRGKDSSEDQQTDDDGDAAAYDDGGKWAGDVMLMLWYLQGVPRLFSYILSVQSCDQQSDDHLRILTCEHQSLLRSPLWWQSWNHQQLLIRCFWTFHNVTTLLPRLDLLQTRFWHHVKS